MKKTVMVHDLSLDNPGMNLLDFKKFSSVVKKLAGLFIVHSTAIDTVSHAAAVLYYKK